MLCVCVHILRDVTIAQKFTAFFWPIIRDIIPIFHFFSSSLEMCTGDYTFLFCTYQYTQKNSSYQELCTGGYYHPIPTNTHRSRICFSHKPPLSSSL